MKKMKSLLEWVIIWIVKGHRALWTTVALDAVTWGAVGYFMPWWLILPFLLLRFVSTFVVYTAAFWRGLDQGAGQVLSKMRKQHDALGQLLVAGMQPEESEEHRTLH